MALTWMDSRYQSKCGGCAEQIDIGDRIAYDFEEKCAFCEDCGKEEVEFQAAKPSKLDNIESRFED